MTAHTPQPNRQTLYVAIALALGILVGELLSLTVGGTAAVFGTSMSAHHILGLKQVPRVWLFAI